jgi:predicted dehydrogenase
MHKTEKTIRWGVLGCGGIAAKFAHSIAVVENQQLIAAASNTPDKAKQYAEVHNVELWFDSYNALLQQSAVDAVYVANTHNFHFETVSSALRAGKHVVCEKPLAVNAGEVTMLIDIAQQAGCFLMEGMWTRFLPALGLAKRWVDEGVIGTVVQIEASFGFANKWSAESRMINPALAGGTLLDMGIYPLSLASFFLNGAKPSVVRGISSLCSTGVDSDDALLLQYGTLYKALLRSSFDLNLPNDATVYGTAGKIYIPPMFIGAERVELQRENETIVKSFPMTHNEGFRFEIEHAGECIRQGLQESPVMPLGETLMLAETMDTLRAEWGIRYPFE